MSVWRRLISLRAIGIFCFVFLLGEVANVGKRLAKPVACCSQFNLHVLFSPVFFFNTSFKRRLIARR